MDVFLTALAVGAAGLVAGASVDRSIVALPAWHRVGVVPWASFTREADLGNGRVLYPILGIAPPVLLAAAAVAAWSANDSPAPLVVAFVVSAGGLAMTILAAPNIFRTRGTDDTVALGKAIAGFERWHGARALLQFLGFVASIWAFVALTGR